MEVERESTSAPALMSSPGLREQIVAPDVGDWQGGEAVRSEGDPEEEEGEFEFNFAARDSESGSQIDADDIFSNGRVTPAYPVFCRKLYAAAIQAAEDNTSRRLPLCQLLSDERHDPSSSSASSSATDADELEGIPLDIYCAWSPRTSAAATPARCQKISSTGDAPRFLQRLLNLVARRSQGGKGSLAFVVDEIIKSTPCQEKESAPASVGRRRKFPPYMPAGVVAVFRQPRRQSFKKN